MWRARSAILAAAALLAAPAATHAGGVDETCPLALVRTDAATVNFFFPDESATYWLGRYEGVPGTRIRLTGSFPHARYMSFNVYDPAGRPLDSIADHQIDPARGSVNPFRPNASRTASKRDYTVT